MKDVAVVTKEMRGIIKDMKGIMACRLKRWKKTKGDPAHDVIYIDGGSSFEIEHSERLANTRRILDAMKVYGEANGFKLIGVIQYNFGRIWLRRDVPELFVWTVYLEDVHGNVLDQTEVDAETSVEAQTLGDTIFKESEFPNGYPIGYAVVAYRNFCAIVGQ